MNVDAILATLHEDRVEYLLIGGMNFLLRHAPELTFDVDIWVRDQPANLAALNRALRKLEAAWGPTETAWAPVPEDWRWLQRQACYCLTTSQGALDVFREVLGLEGRFEACRTAGLASATAAGVPFIGLNDRDMLRCQEALPPDQRKPRRIELLRAVLRRGAPAVEPPATC